MVTQDVRTVSLAYCAFIRANVLERSKHKIIITNKLVIAQPITVKCSRQYKSWFMTCYITIPIIPSDEIVNQHLKTLSSIITSYLNQF